MHQREHVIASSRSSMRHPPQCARTALLPMIEAVCRSRGSWTGVACSHKTGEGLFRSAQSSAGATHVSRGPPRICRFLSRQSSQLRPWTGQRAPRMQSAQCLVCWFQRSSSTSLRVSSGGSGAAGSVRYGPPAAPLIQPLPKLRHIPARKHTSAWYHMQPSWCLNCQAVGVMMLQ